MRRHVPQTGPLLHRPQGSKWICRSFQSCSPTEFIASCLATIAHGSPQPQPLRLFRANAIPRSFHTPFLGNLQQGSPMTPATRHMLTLGRYQLFQPEYPRYARLSTLSPNQTATTAVLDEPSTPHTQTSSSSSVKPRLAARKPNSRQSGSPWTHQEDEILFDLRQQRVKWRTIGAQLNRTVASCYSRYYRFLDPFLGDAIESELDEEEDDVEAGNESGGASIKEKILSGTLEKPNVRPQPYMEHGPWKAKDREQLELMVTAKVPWSIIAHQLQRNQDSCKEKWLRIQKSHIEKRRYSKKVRGGQWTRLYKEGFTPHHRDQLVRAVEKHLTAKRASAIYDSNPLRILGVNDPDEEEEEGEEVGTFGPLMMRPPPLPLDQQPATDNNSSVQDPSMETIDWEAISRALNNKFPASRLRSIYLELAVAKLVWTPEEDERLFRAVIRLGPPELQPKIWTMIKEAFGDVIRTSNDYRARWRELDMPQLEREWDFSEKTKFWRRWMEYQEAGSLLDQEASSSDKNGSTQSVIEPRPLLLKPSHEPSTQSRMDAWDLIAEGLEYRHGRDCQLYFDRTTRNFPKDPELFRYLTLELAKAYLEPRTVSWSTEASRMLVATVNSFLQANRVVKWASVAQALDYQYTAEQCEAKWLYWSQNHVPTPDDAPKYGNKEGALEIGPDSLEHLSKPSKVEVERESDDKDKKDTERRLWTDDEVELLKKGVEEYGLQWHKIRDAYLPHRATQMIHERYWRMQAKKTGRFSEKERSQLETAIEIFGEDADWELIAGQVPGRTASQCRKNWKYSKTHHVHKLDEPWTDQDRERLKGAVARFGKKRWTLVSEFVVGKTPDQCRNEWREKMDPVVDTSRWSGQERDRLMELVMDQLSRKGKRKIDWKEIAKEFKGRTAQQCRLQFDVHRALYRLQGDY
ncbi:Myb-like DNA-binding domain protein [Linnemannia elongata]|nr:Myb-like DNA-binding domain protein [Linnemannia elongata]